MSKTKYGHLRNTEKIANDYFFSTGKEVGFSHINKFGRNKDIDQGTTPETIWSKSGSYTLLTVEQFQDVKSTSGNDTGVVSSSSNIVTSFLILPSGNISLMCAASTFVSDGLAVGAMLINQTVIDHSIVVEVVSETNVIVQPMHDFDALATGNLLDFIMSTGTGAAVLHIFGLDKNCNQQREFLVLDGTNNVRTKHKYLRTNRAHTDLTGSNRINMGSISLTGIIDSTVSAYIDAGDGQTLQAIYTVPNGKTAYMTNVNLSSHRIGTTSNSMVSVTLRINKFIPEGHIAIVEDTFSVSTVGSSSFQRAYSPYKVFKQRTDIWLQVDYSTDNNMNVSGGFDIILEDNSNF